MPPEIDIVEESPLWKDAPTAPAQIRRAVAAVAADPAKAASFGAGDHLCVVLADDASIARLNRRWRDKDAPTNVLAFPAPPHPGAEGPRFLGDIVLAFETIEREARADGKTIDGHVAHLVAHGLLHLLGHDHETRVEAERMERLEARILATLGIADPYAVEIA